jgi:lipopolysaccharide export system permease protein
MRILTRHVVVEFAKIFFFALSLLTSCILIFFVFKQGHEEGLGLVQLMRLVPYVLPDALRFTVPGTALFAACTVFGRMSGANEIVAIKSLGISPWVVVWPVLVCSFFLSLASVWLNDVAVSWGHAGVQRVALEAIDEIVYGMLRVQRSYSSSKFTVNVKRVEGRRLIQPTLIFQDGSRSRSVTVRAEEAELRADHGTHVMVITCRNATIDLEGGGTARLDSIEREIPLADAGRKTDRSGLPTQMSLAAVYQRLPEKLEFIRRLEEVLAAKAAYQMLTGNFDNLAGDEWMGVGSQLSFAREMLHRFRAEPQRRYAGGFSCLCFVWVGIPMAIRLRNSDMLSSFFVCFLPILLVYYPLFSWSLDGAKVGNLHPAFLWLGNGVLALWGAWLMRRVLRY